jgi:hypothetical protein
MELQDYIKVSSSQSLVFSHIELSILGKKLSIFNGYDAGLFGEVQNNKKEHHFLLNSHLLNLSYQHPKLLLILLILLEED